MFHSHPPSGPASPGSGSRETSDQGVTSQSASPSPGLLALVQPFHTHHISNTMDSQAGGGSSGASLCLPQAYGAWPGTGRPACVSGGSAPQPPPHGGHLPSRGRCCPLAPALTPPVQPRLMGGVVSPPTWRWASRVWACGSVPPWLPALAEALADGPTDPPLPCPFQSWCPQ